MHVASAGAGTLSAAAAATSWYGVSGKMVLFYSPLPDRGMQLAAGSDAIQFKYCPVELSILTDSKENLAQF